MIVVGSAPPGSPEVPGPPLGVWSPEAHGRPSGRPPGPWLPRDPYAQTKMSPAKAFRVNSEGDDVADPKLSSGPFAERPAAAKGPLAEWPAVATCAEVEARKQSRRAWRGSDVGEDLDLGPCRCTSFASSAGGFGSAAPGALRLISASTSRQHHIKRDMGFVNADCVEESPAMVGICDGVSEVQSLGLRPDAFPREYLRRFRENLEARGITGGASGHDGALAADGSWVIEAMEEAFVATESEGASTALIAVLEDGSRFVIANLGDCCLLLLRPDPSEPQRMTIAYKTEPLRFDHNKPYQVARLDGFSEAKVRAVIKQTKVDTFPAQHGDIIVIGSDGLWDNLHDDEAVKIVEQHCAVSGHVAGGPPPLPVWGTGAPAPTVEQLSGAADALVVAAHAGICVGQVDAKGKTVWPPQARNTPSGMGGKPDDTTAIVAAAVQRGGHCVALEPQAVFRTQPTWINTACCSTTAGAAPLGLGGPLAACSGASGSCGAIGASHAGAAPGSCSVS
mmetsp:Transcript_132818/g.283787  ORF Transcript_132818/g.283787 Transcript_132818/m.283787 type:complete len:507 (-) Transcript_132818:294-1814(-)